MPDKLYTETDSFFLVSLLFPLSVLELFKIYNLFQHGNANVNQIIRVLSHNSMHKTRLNDAAKYDKIAHGAARVTVAGSTHSPGGRGEEEEVKILFNQRRWEYATKGYESIVGSSLT